MQLVLARNTDLAALHGPLEMIDRCAEVVCISVVVAHTAQSVRRNMAYQNTLVPQKLTGLVQKWAELCLLADVDPASSTTSSDVAAALHAQRASLTAEVGLTSEQAARARAFGVRHHDALVSGVAAFREAVGVVVTLQNNSESVLKFYRLGATFNVPLLTEQQRARLLVWIRLHRDLIGYIVAGQPAMCTPLLSPAGHSLHAS